MEKQDLDKSDYLWIEDEIKKLESTDSGEGLEFFLEYISEVYPEYYYREAIKDPHSLVGKPDLLEIGDVLEKARESKKPEKIFDEADWERCGFVFYSSPLVDTYFGPKWYTISVYHEPLYPFWYEGGYSSYSPIINPETPWVVSVHREVWLSYTGDSRIEREVLGRFNTLEAACHHVCVKYNYHRLDIKQQLIDITDPQLDQWGKNMKFIAEFQDEAEFELKKMTLNEPGPYWGTKKENGNLSIWVLIEKPPEENWPEHYLDTQSDALFSDEEIPF